MIQTAIAIQASGSRLEDRAAILAVEGWTVLVVADGAGGLFGGAAAADAVVRCVTDRAPTLAHPEDPGAWSELLTWIDLEIEADPDAGETTAVVAAVSPGRLVGASVGDSEAWLIGDGEPLELTSRQRRKPFLGTGAACPASFAREDWQETLVVGTDGLWKYGRPERIAEAARSDELKALPERLIHLARLRSGALADDIAVVVCRPGKI